MDYVPDAATNVIRYVSFGYNLLTGNPEGEFDLGGRDTGIKISYPIFDFSYDEGKQTYYLDQVVSIPDQVAFAPYGGCVSETQTAVFTGAKSYRDELAVAVEASGEVSYEYSS